MNKLLLLAFVTVSCGPQVPEKFTATFQGGLPGETYAMVVTSFDGSGASLTSTPFNDFKPGGLTPSISGEFLSYRGESVSYQLTRWDSSGLSTAFSETLPPRGCCSIGFVVTISGATSKGVWVQRGQEPPKPSTTKVRARIVNQYAESIFSVRAKPQSFPASSTLVNGVRVEAYKSHTGASVLEISAGEAVSFEVDATSLGTTRTWNIDLTTPTKGTDVAEFIYDYDLALAQFAMRFKWSQ